MEICPSAAVKGTMTGTDDVPLTNGSETEAVGLEAYESIRVTDATETVILSVVAKVAEVGTAILKLSIEAEPFTAVNIEGVIKDEF